MSDRAFDYCLAIAAIAVVVMFLAILGYAYVDHRHKKELRAYDRFTKLRQPMPWDRN